MHIKQEHIKHYQAVVIGVSTGGMNALSTLLPALPSDFPAPVIVVQHLHPNQGDYHIKYYNQFCHLNVLEIEDKDYVRRGNIYFAPPNYHALIEENRSFVLNTDEKVNYARPSIDVLFKSAANVYRHLLVGVILTGANRDGAKGMNKIKQLGGLTIIQDPDEARADSMPLAALRSAKIDYIRPLSKIGTILNNICI